MSLLTTLIGEEIIGRENFSPGTPPFVKQWNRKENENTAINELETFCLGVLYLHSVWKSSKKGAFNIASEASCTYILSVQKFMKNTQNILFQRVFENLILWSNSVTRHVNFKKTKIGGKCQNWKRTNTTFWVICKHCSNVHVEKKLKLHPPIFKFKTAF